MKKALSLIVMLLGFTSLVFSQSIFGKTWTGVVRDYYTYVYEFSADGTSYRRSITTDKSSDVSYSNFTIIDVIINNGGGTIYSLRQGTPPEPRGDYPREYWGKINDRFSYRIIDEHTIEVTSLAMRPRFNDIDPTEAKRLAEIKEKEKQEQKLAAEEEERKANTLIREQVLKKIKLDGSYISTGKSSWHALKFIDEKDSIKAFVVYNDGSNETADLYGCGIDGSALTVARSSFTILSNGNLQSSAGNAFMYVPFSGVKGKTYSRIRGRGDLAYSFSDSHYIAQTSNGRIIDEADRTYEYANGVINLKYRGQVFGWLTEVGPFLVNGTGEIWQLDR